MKILLAAFSLPFFVLLPVLPGGAVTITPVYDSDERNANPPTGFWDETPLTEEQKDEIGPSGNDAETLGEARRKALEHALGLMDAKLAGDVTIKAWVGFNYELDSTPPGIVLATAVPCLVRSSLLPRPQTLYPSALAKSILPDEKSLRTGDGPCGGRDISMRFNGNFPFHYAFDTEREGVRAFDFVYIVLHEIFHGLGFWTSFRKDGSWGLRRPSIYEEQLYSEADENFLHMLSESRRAAAIVSGDGLSWYGQPSAGCSHGRLVGERDKDGGTTPDGKPLLHAPSRYRGFAAAHFHPSVDPDDILEPATPLATKDMTLALALLKDMGWRINDPAIPSCAPETSATPPPSAQPSAPADTSASATPDGPENQREPEPGEPAPTARPDGTPDGADLQPLPPEDGYGSGGNPGDGSGSGVADRQGGGGCAVASDGGLRSEKMFGDLFALLSALAPAAFGKRRREKAGGRRVSRNSRGTVLPAGLSGFSHAQKPSISGFGGKNEKTSLSQLDFQRTSQNIRRARQDARRRSPVLRVKQPVELQATRLKPPGHLHLRDIPLFHNLADLHGQNALYRPFGSFLVSSLFLEKIFKRLPCFSRLDIPRHFKPLILLVAISTSLSGVFRVFLINPCKSIVSAR